MKQVELTPEVLEELLRDLPSILHKFNNDVVKKSSRQLVVSNLEEALGGLT